jgi:uncharacterized protein (DUF427 family)
MMWNYTGNERPNFAIEPAIGQESVWDYPRPPVAEATSRLVEVMAGDVQVARTWHSYRLKETASPPTYYLPPGDVDRDLLVPVKGSSICEWKGAAVYWALRSDPDTVVAWCYPNPRPPFDRLRNSLAFYPGRIDCFVDGELVTPQPGRFYGGWITSDVVGPFKGEPGTGHW